MFFPTITLIAASLAMGPSGVIPLTITAIPSSIEVGASLSILWQTNGTDPPLINMQIENPVTSFQPLTDLTTSTGNVRFDVPDIPTGQYNVIFFDDQDVIYAETSIQILNPSSTASGSANPSGTPSIAISGSPSTTPSDTPATSSGSGSSPITSSGSTSSTGSSHPTGVVVHHNHAGAIAGGVVGGVVAIILALLAGWYVRRKRPVAAEESGLDLKEKVQFLPTPIGTALASGSAVHDEEEFRPWAEYGQTAGSSTTAAAGSTGAEVEVSSPKQPIIMRWDPPSQPGSAPSREELEDEVRRLRDQVSSLSPPSYSGHEGDPSV
ncbi:hypothetical protein B0H11DRAFT_2104286 [Mycena galericulata]|nr:hypothetical protein B0H11DRAFT_2104286 [Mycena galericulata]